MSEILPDGYIRLYRKLLQNTIWRSRSAALKVVAITCLLKANFKDNYWGNILIKRGSFITSQRKLAQECNINRETLRGCFSTLKDTHFITHKHTHSYSIITICNYESYQANSYPQHPLTHPETHPETHPKWPKLGPTGGLNKGHNIIKNNNKKNIKSKDFICKDCKNYEKEHIDNRGKKAGFCPILNTYLPPYTVATTCEHKKPIPAESEEK